MIRLPLSLFLLATMAVPAVRAALPPSPVATFLKGHCVDCHNDDVKKGDFDLSALVFELGDPDEFNRWVHVLDRVTAGEMPPKTEERPEATPLRRFIQELGATLHAADASRISNDGRVRARRLTRFEYERSLHDLLGIDVPLMDLLPEDPRTDRFDTVSGAQQVSHHLLEKYLAAIDVALDAAFARAFEPLSTYRLEMRGPQLQQLRAGGREPGPRPEHQDAVAWSNGVAFHGRIPPTKAPESGWYRVSLRVSAVNPPADGEVWCSVRSGVCFAVAPTLFWLGSFAATSQEREHTFEAWIQAGHMLEIRPNDSALKRARYGTVVPTAEAERAGIPGVAIKSLTLERIHRGLPPAVQRERLFATIKLASTPTVSTDELQPAKRRAAAAPARQHSAAIGVSETPREDAARLVLDFAARVFRYPVSEAEAEPYVALAHAELENGANLLEALRGAFRGVLSSPRFLYLEEPVGPLPAHALATRLSYFLWSSPPDDALRVLADTGRLMEPGVLRAQVERMLEHPRSAAFVENFTNQWLNLTEIDFTVPDAKLYPEFDEGLKHAMLDETRVFFRELLQRDLGVAHLVDSPFTLINSRLARHYRIPWPGGEGVQRVPLRKEDHRGGLITHGSVLKVTANGTSTSPVLRGVFMLERIMGVHVPPVPAGVPALEPDIRGAKTIREELDKHRNVTSCAACHVKIDPPGFALESFDVTGAWRDRYRVARDGGKGFEPGPVVDSGDRMPDGRAFADIDEFKQLLLEDKEQLARNLASQLVTYATGAGISFADRTAIEEIVSSTKVGEHGVRSLVHAVVMSPLFRHK